MTFVDGLWQTDEDFGDETVYPNYRGIDELEVLCADQQFDFVVVGGGGAGASAAIEAAEREASVLVLEKMAFPGGSSQESHGGIRLLPREAAEAVAEHFFALCQGATPRDVIDAFVNGLLELAPWVEAHGGKLLLRPDDEMAYQISRWKFPVRLEGTSFPGAPFADALGRRSKMRPIRPGREAGAAVWDMLAQSMAKLNVPVVTNASVCRLIQEFPERSVVGVEVERPDGTTMEVRAGKAVILCCGGFEYSPDMMKQFLGVSIPALGPPGRNTGDGIRMAMDIGADLWHMSAMASTVGYQPPEIKAGFHAKVPDYAFILVDQDGCRYVCETDVETHNAAQPMMMQDARTGDFRRIPSFVIFDDETRRTDIVAMVDTGENRHYPWSQDNSAEIERGWISKAGSIAQLAGLLGLAVDALEASVADFNRAAQGEGPDPLGRPPEKMRPISVSPFYGAPVYPMLLNTQGGPRRSARCEVLRPDGTPIPGLYSAGELGSLWNRRYPGSGNLSEALITGRLAVRSALDG
jgi:succinate dehydrogenase/fumarate reductase flavoprotein subunit